MLVSKWWILGLLAVASLAAAAPQEDGTLVGVTFDDPELHYEDYLNEEDMSEDDLNELADVIANDVAMDEDGGKIMLMFHSVVYLLLHLLFFNCH